MKWLIIYFSGTGNTKKITGEICEELKNNGEEVQQLSLEQVLESSEQLPDADGLGIGFPVYKFSFPDNFQRLFPILEHWKCRQNQTKIPLFAFSTYCRFPAHSLRNLFLQMKPLGFRPISSRAFKSPSNGIASLKEKNSFEYTSVMYFENRVQDHIKCFIQDILKTDGLRALKKPQGFPFLEKIKISLVESIEQSRYPRLSINREACSLCGACVRLCPNNNLIILNGIIEIKDRTGCLHCLRCLHLCPNRAVRFGPLVQGPQRYTHQTMNKLYNEACQKEENSPQPGTPAVKRRWARGIILFWLRSRCKIDL